MIKQYTFHITIGAFFILALWVATPIVVAVCFGLPKGPGEFGDIFGVINALFSGLALIGVVIAIFLQQKELSLSTMELRNSAKALTKQVELSADTARMQTLPILMELQKARVRTYGGEYFKHFKDSEFTEENLVEQIEEMKRVIEEAPVKRQEFKKLIDETPKHRDVYGHNTVLDDLQHHLKDWEKRETISRNVIPQMELLVSYMRDMSLLYEKMRETKL